MYLQYVQKQEFKTQEYSNWIATRNELATVCILICIIINVL